MDFLGDLCMKEGCNFPISGSWVARSPRAEQQQQPCSQSFSIHQRAVSWSWCVSVHGRKDLEACSCGLLFSKQ